MRGYFVKNIGQNRGKPRIWLEKLQVSTAGLKPGDRFDVELRGGAISLRANPDGSRTVSAKHDKRTGQSLPVIDINSADLLALFDGMSAVRVVQKDGEIHLLPLASEIKKRDRLRRLRTKLQQRAPLAIGSLAHGAGLLDDAVHAGFKSAGIETRQVFANEIRSELLDHGSEVMPHWSSDTVPLSAPMQELAFDENAMERLPRADVMVAGLPCSGASVAGRAKRGTSHPEEHPEVGHLVVAALVLLSRANPAAIVLENVVPYASSASASILRNQLKDLGYAIHERVLDGKDFNALEHRKRWFMVAVTEGIEFSWDMLELPAKEPLRLSDVLDPIAEDDPCWSEMAGLKSKQERDMAAGKGFRMQIYDGSEDHIGTLTKGMAKNRSTDPKIRHPSNPNLLRIPTTAEHARVKQFDPSVVAGLSATLGHEILGQAVLKKPPELTAQALGKALLAHVQAAPQPEVQREKVVRSNITLKGPDGSVVTELRRPVAGAVYEGAITLNERGAVIQDIGGGVGIVYKAAAVGPVQLGQRVRIRHHKLSESAQVDVLDEPAASRRAVRMA